MSHRCSTHHFHGAAASRRRRRVLLKKEKEEDEMTRKIKLLHSSNTTQHGYRYIPGAHCPKEDGSDDASIILVPPIYADRRTATHLGTKEILVQVNFQATRYRYENLSQMRQTTTHLESTINNSDNHNGQES